MLLPIIDWSTLTNIDTLEKIASFLFIVISVLIYIVHFFIKRCNRKQKTYKWRRNLIEKKLIKDYRTYIDPKQNILKRFWSRYDSKKSIYIETRFQDKPPHDKEDPVENNKTKDSKSLIKYYLNDILVNNNNTNTFLFCVLAGSGMGKTTFAVNLLKQYINKYNEDTIPYDIYLFSLYTNTIDDIRNSIKIDDKNPSCILILDALDENKEAIENYEQFKDELEQLIKDYSFKAIIITCRTQFFDNEKDEPAKTTILGDGSSHGSKYSEHYKKQYLSVFNDKEIRKYIKEKFPCCLNFNNRRKRKKAKEIVKKCTSLMVRPLLLSYIDDLLDEKDADLSKITNIYKILIDKWIDREVQYWETYDNSISSEELKKKLKSFSEELAVKIYYNNRGQRISVKEVDKFMKEKLFTGKYKYKKRSLVNRDAFGNIKFAHKSFLEYFLAKQMFEGKIYLPSFEGMDMAETFYQELCNKEMESSPKTTRKWRRNLIEQRLGVHYRLFSYLKDNIYIQTRAQLVPPNDYEEPVESVYNMSVNLIKLYLNDILIRNNTGAHLYFVLAGSGMGKTTFAVNLLKQYINKYKEKTIPYDIYLFNLGINDTFNEIEKIDKEIQRKSILILDALDENPEAVENYGKFINKLEQLIKDFRIVIITCRTQFFDDIDHEPKESSLYYIDGKFGVILKEHYIKHYISFFNDEDIDRYIKQKYDNRNKRKKAKEIVEKNKSLMVRPLLLSYIDDLLDEKDADLSKITNIYKILIDKCLDREVQYWKNRKNKNIKPDELKCELYSFSEELAAEIFNNQDKNGGLFLSKIEMFEFIKNHNYIDYNYKRLPLVNRDVSGNIKFAHKSFLEYFLAKQMFEGKISVSFEGMDMAETFYQEFREI